MSFEMFTSGVLVGIVLSLVIFGIIITSQRYDVASQICSWRNLTLMSYELEPSGNGRYSQIVCHNETYVPIYDGVVIEK